MLSQKIRDVIIASKLLDEKTVNTLTEESQKKGISLERNIVEKKLIPETKLYEKLSQSWKVPYIDLSGMPLSPEVVHLIPENVARHYEIIVFAVDNDKASIACTDPFNLEALDLVSKKLSKVVKAHLTSPSSFIGALRWYHQKGLREEFQEIEDQAELEENKEKSKTKDSSHSSEVAPVIHIVDQILEHAVFEEASDIHIEPREKELVIRYRVDGILREVMSLPRTLQAPLVARIKVLSKLKLDEHRLPQDGRFTLRSQSYKVTFRVSVIPVFDGEKIVLRLLNESAQVLNLEQLGLLPEPLAILRRNISKPHGMILVTGPTGSGKTTTLYTVLNILNTSKVNVLTIEDPIEYRMARINQSQVQPKIGFSFANGLRSLLRQDPDIIMVGEIRDNETAEISVHAAMTGHLLLSTLHTNDAAGALPRLTEMGVPSFLIASTTNLVIGQRLVRKICPECKKSYSLSKDDIAKLEKQINFSSLLKSLEKYTESSGKKGEVEFFRGVGCNACNMEGYQGRIGIYELLEVTKPIAQSIIQGESALEIRKRAMDEGMLTMLEDGFIKAEKGITSIEEVLRVTKE